MEGLAKATKGLGNSEGLMEGNIIMMVMMIGDGNSERRGGIAGRENPRVGGQEGGRRH